MSLSPQATEPEPLDQLPRISAVASFLEAVEQSNIRQCHWKSNLDLGRSLMGTADLDLLVALEDLVELENLLRSLGAVQTVNVGPKYLPGLYDWLLLDEPTGTLVHLHIHERMVLGEQRVKDHHLPIEAFVLDNTRVIDGVRIPTVSVELLILWIRSLVKTTPRACLRTALGRQASPFPDHISAELTWLASSCTDEEVLSALEDSGLRLSAEPLNDFLKRVRTGGVNAAWVLLARRRLLKELVRYRRVPWIVDRFRKALFRFRYSRPGVRVARIPKKRVLGGGTLTAIVGADGSGKSSLVNDLTHWSRSKVDTVQIFNGQPKRDRFLMLLRKLDELSGGRKSLHTGELIWIYVARVRKRLHDRSRTVAAAGQPVISDRYPLPEFSSMISPMDGPRLQRNSHPGLSGYLADMEKSAYDHIGPADLTIVLDAPLSALRERKPETPLAEHERKAEAVNTVAASGAYSVIDATRPYEEVLTEAKRLWFRSLRELQQHHGPDR